MNEVLGNRSNYKYSLALALIATSPRLCCLLDIKIATDKQSKSSLKIPDFIIGELIIFNQFRRPTRTKASDNREPSLAAIPSADGHMLHTSVLAMTSDTRMSGWLLRFFFFGAKN